MDIEKAIALLNECIVLHHWAPEQDRRDALRLGIEALKRIRYLRTPSATAGAGWLDGETEE